MPSACLGGRDAGPLSRAGEGQGEGPGAIRIKRCGSAAASRSVRRVLIPHPNPLPHGRGSAARFERGPSQGARHMRSLSPLSHALWRRALPDHAGHASPTRNGPSTRSATAISGKPDSLARARDVVTVRHLILDPCGSILIPRGIEFYRMTTGHPRFRCSRSC